MTLVLTSSFLKQHFNDLNISVGNSRIAPSLSARNLGVIFDDHMSLDKQINSICKSAFFHLRNIGSIRNILTDDACSQLIHSLVTVRIDYCKSLLYGMPDSTCTLFRLQKVLNFHTLLRSLRSCIGFQLDSVLLSKFFC